MGIRICPECGGKVSTTRDDCPHCGYVFIQTKKCPECEEDIPADASECPVCGFRFVAVATENPPVVPVVPVCSENEEKRAPENISAQAEEKTSENREEGQPEPEIAIPAVAVPQTEPALSVIPETKEETPIPESVSSVAAEEADDGIAEPAVECPYCGGKGFMPIGISYYMCETCKGKFLQTDRTETPVSARAYTESKPVAAIPIPPEQREKTPEPQAETAFPEEEPEEISEEPEEICEDPEEICEDPEEICEEEMPRRLDTEKPKKGRKRNKKIALILLPIGACLIAFFIILGTVIIPVSKYNKAISLKDAGKYSEAIRAFEALDGYKDSSTKIAEIRENPNYIQSAKIGDTIIFGAYEQDNNKSNGKEKIEWQILAKEGTKILVISNYALDCLPYNTSYTNVTWETCTLRTWLNGTFYDSAFSGAEKAKIEKTTVTADKNPSYSTNPGNDTRDNVFLLSITEANKYFSSDEARKCAPTAYVIAQEVYTDHHYNTCWWWLRSPGGDQYRAASVGNVGWVYYYGYYVYYGNYAVRPALWINLAS